MKQMYKVCLGRNRAPALRFRGVILTLVRPRSRAPTHGKLKISFIKVTMQERMSE